MRIPMTVHVECPLCGFTNSVRVTADQQRKELVLCDNEQGGCDRWFAVEITFTPQVRTFTLKEA